MPLCILRPKGWAGKLEDGDDVPDPLDAEEAARAAGRPEWVPWFDTTYGVIVRAPNPNAARRLVTARATGDEAKEGRPQIWEDPARVTCEPLTDDGPIQVIMREHFRS